MVTKLPDDFLSTILGSATGTTTSVTTDEIASVFKNFIGTLHKSDRFSDQFLLQPFGPGADAKPEPPKPQKPKDPEFYGEW